jgi:hypothetical protein
MYEVIGAGTIEVRTGQVRPAEASQNQISADNSRLSRRLATAILALSSISTLLSGCSEPEQYPLPGEHKLRVIPSGEEGNDTKCDAVEIQEYLSPKNDFNVYWDQVILAYKMQGIHLQDTNISRTDHSSTYRYTVNKPTTFPLSYQQQITLFGRTFDWNNKIVVNVPLNCTP